MKILESIGRVILTSIACLLFAGTMISAFIWMGKTGWKFGDMATTASLGFLALWFLIVLVLSRQ